MTYFNENKGKVSSDLLREWDEFNKVGDNFESLKKFIFGYKTSLFKKKINAFEKSIQQSLKLGLLLNKVKLLFKECDKNQYICFLTQFGEKRKLHAKHTKHAYFVTSLSM